MENEIIMVNISLADYNVGLEARTKVDILKRITLGSKYDISRKEMAEVLDFELPEEQPHV